MTAMSVVFAATGRESAANFVSALVYVYSLLILIYIVSTWIFATGARPPYSRALDAVLTFLRDVSEPYLRIFRRFVPMVGPLDISPIIALLVLQVVGNIVVSLLRG